MSVATEEEARRKDVLTGLGDHRELTNAFDEELAKATDEARDLSLAMVDIDHFSRINEENGHLVGDEVLRTIAAHLSNAASDNASVFRYGADQFAVVFPDVEKEQAFLLLEQVRQAFDKEHIIVSNKQKVRLRLSLSVGISSYPEDGSRGKDIIRKAEGALYRAKTTGRNKVCLSREERMMTKTSHYTQGQLERLSHLAKREGVGEAVLLREALDDVLKKYDVPFGLPW